MNAKQIFLLVGIIVFLNGCTMTPKYKRPPQPIPDTLPQGEAYMEGRFSDDARSVINLEWQNVFLDEKLQKVIEISLENNRDLRLVILNVERARAFYGVRRSELFPSFTASATGSKQHVPADLSTTGEALTTEQYSVNLGIVSWEIDLFGRIQSLKEQALQEYLASEQVQRGTRTALIGEVARAYLTLAADLENLKVARSTLETQQNMYSMIWQQYDKGIATESDLRRSQTQVDAATRDIARYTQLVGQDQNALNLLAGSSVSSDLLPPDLKSVLPLKDVSPGLSSEVLLRRPDIVATEHRLKAANALIGAARAAFFPRISLTTAIGTASNELSGLFESGSKAWNFAPQATMPIFDARVWAAFRVSKTEREISVAQYEKAIQTAFREVADALILRGMVDQQVTAQKSIVASAQKIYELSVQRYTQGIDGYLSVLDAQRSLYGAQQELTSLRLAKRLSQVKLYVVLGGDGKSENPPSKISDSEKVEE